MYDVIVIGAGPAGLAASITASRRKLQTLVLTKTMEPLDYQTADGVIQLSELLKKFNEENKYLEVKRGEVVLVDKNIVSFSAEVTEGKAYYCKSVVLAYGGTQGQFNHLENLSAKRFSGSVKVDSSMQTSVPGLFAAGSLTESGSEVDVAVAEGIKAAVGAWSFLQNQKV